MVLACSRLSDSGEDVKEKARRPQFPPVLFSCLRFLNTADPTVSEPGTGYNSFICKLQFGTVFSCNKSNSLVKMFMMIEL